VRRRLPSALGALALAAAASACDVSPRSASAAPQSWRTLDVARQLSDSGVHQVRVDYEAGQLDVHGADPALLYDMSLRYDESRTEPVHALAADARSLELGVRTRGDERIGRRGAGEMRLGLTRRTPLDLTFELGAVEADLDLGGLAIGNLAIRSGASDARVRFQEPNRVPMRRLAINVGAASLRATGLANANAEALAIGAGVGSVELDFGGQWTRDLTATVDITLGSVTVHVPSDIGVRLDVDRMLASLDTGGLERREDAYYSDNWDTATHRLRLEVDTVVGNFELDRTAP
jgi:hypothetical protein